MSTVHYEGIDGKSAKRGMEDCEGDDGKEEFDWGHCKVKERRDKKSVSSLEGRRVERREGKEKKGGDWIATVTAKGAI